MKTQRIGGYAALLAAVTVVVGIGMYATTLSDYTAEGITASEAVTFLAENQTAMYIWNFVTLILFGLALIVVALPLHDRMRYGAPFVSRLATAFAMVWAGLLIAGGMVVNVGNSSVVGLHEEGSAITESVWASVDTISGALSGQIEIVGAVFILLVSIGGLLSKALPVALNVLGILMSISAFVTIVPALELVAIGFGLGLIVWFGWVGILMITDHNLAKIFPPLPPHEFEITHHL